MSTDPSDLAAGDGENRPMTNLTAKLVVRGADKAIALYERVFGARLLQRHTVGDAVVFAELDAFGGRIQVKDEDMTDPSPQALGRPGVLLDVTTDDPDALATRMVQAGGEIVFPVADQPYGSRQGRVRDPFGHEWLIGTPITMTSEEIQQAMDELGPS